MIHNMPLNMMQLSIIVPIYNVEKYLRKCVESLLLQDLSQNGYEIILVNDGSTDDSGRIADEYAASYLNIHVIHQPNAGLSEARNTGIKDAHGEYIMFVDSDDYLEPNVLKGLVEKMTAEDLDVLRFNYQNVNEQGKVIEPNKISKPFVDYRDEICDGFTFLNDCLGSACYAWQFILKHELTCTFMSDIYFEDVDWTPRMLIKAQRVTSVCTVVYNYLQRQGSITLSQDEVRIRKALNDRITIIKTLKETSATLHDHRWFDGMVASIVISVISRVAKSFYSERHDWIARLRSLNVFPVSSYHLTPAAKRKRILLNLSPCLYCWLMHKR